VETPEKTEGWNYKSITVGKIIKAKMEEKRRDKNTYT